VTASDLPGDGVFIAIAGAVVAVVLLILLGLALVLRRDMKAKLGSLEVTLGAGDKRPKGQPNLATQVAQIAAKTDGMASSMRKMADGMLARVDHVDAVLAQLRTDLELIRSRVEAIEKERRS
jgi:hypothetical protein